MWVLLHSKECRVCMDFVCLDLLLFFFYIMTAYTVQPRTFYISREKQCVIDTSF